MFSLLRKPPSRFRRIIVTSFSSYCDCIKANNGGSHGTAASFLKSFSTLSPSSPSSTADFLRNSVGLSPESALAAAQTIGRAPNDKSEAVVALFKRFGFSPSDIAEIIIRNSQLLWSDAEKTLEPKLRFLSENGISGQDLVRVISADPMVLNRSVSKQIEPCIRLLNGFYGSSDDIVSLFLLKRGTWFLHQFSEATASNIETLRSHGVPQENIAKMFVIRPRSLSRDTDEFAELVKRAKELGFEASSLMFVHGLASLSGMKIDKWVSKIQVLKSFGWSEEQVRSLIVRQPQIMDCSEERLKRGLRFLRDELKWGPDEIFRYPTVILRSLEKRILPRYAVLRLLISEGLKKRACIGGAFLLSNEMFLRRFVLNYIEEVPQLLELYQTSLKKANLASSAS